MAKNKVIAGDYLNGSVSAMLGMVSITYGLGGYISITKATVDDYEVITDEHRKSVTSGVARGLVGNLLLGGVGLVAGAVTAKSKGTYQLAIQFKSGEKSLIEVDDKIYKAIIKALF